MNAPEFTYKLGIATASWDVPPVGFKFDLIRLERRSGELTAELTAFSRANGTANLLHRARVNLASTRSRAEYANHLDKRLAGPEWSGLIEVASWKVIESFRAGAPAFYLKDAEEPPAVGWALKPLLTASDPVILFGDGGSLKSYTALACAVSLQTGVVLADGLEPMRSLKVAYLDFEWKPWPHYRRLRAICGGGGELPDILYVPCQTGGPLTHQVERLQRIFVEHSIEYAIIDSVGLACDGPPEEAQSAIGFFQGLAQLEVGSLLTAHTNRDGDTQKPFGSAYWHNSARATWYVRRSRAIGSSIDIALFNRKFNDGALHEEPVGIRFDFGTHTTGVSSVAVESSEATTKGSLRDRVAAAVGSGAKTYVELEKELGVSAGSLRKTVQRELGRTFMMLTNSPDGVHRVGLLSSSESA